MSLALITTTMSFFVQPVCDALGFERGAFTIYYSLAALVGVVAMPIWGRIIPKIGIKMSTAIAGAGGAVFMFLFSLCKSLVAFYIVGLAMGIMVAGMTLLPASILINTWFAEKRGLAMGIAMACSGLGGAIFSPIIAGVIASSGWEAGYMLSGGLMFVLTVPVALFVIKARPSELGLRPYGAKDAETDGGSAAAEGGPKEVLGVPSKIATRSASFFLLLGAVVLMNVLASGAQHLPAHLVANGIDATAAASVISIYAFVVIGSKIVLGIVNDKFGSVAAIAATLSLLAASFVVFSFATNYAIAAVAAVLFGLGVAVVTVMPPLLTGQMYGQRDYSAIYAIVGAIASLGLAVGTPIYGIVYDKLGSYDIAFYGCAVAAAVAFAMLVAGLKSSKRLQAT
jgi:MFS family permease